MKGLSKIGTGLIVVFAVALVAILAELTYALWRRRRFRRRALDSGNIDVLSGNQLHSTPLSKELLYFFCWKNQSRIEPAGAPSPALPVSSPATQSRQPESEEDLDAKWKQAVLYGHARFLFTIKEEEERELHGGDTPNHPSAGADRQRTKRVSLEECFAGDGVESDGVLTADNQEIEAVAIDVNDDEKMVFNLTPFSTPCASPPYYTPSPSPGRDATLPLSPENDVNSLETAGSMEAAEEFAFCLKPEGP